MFVNIFPKSLTTLLHQKWPHQRFATAMLPLVSLAEYSERAEAVDSDRHALNEQELLQAGKYKVAKRQKDWLTGRICSKVAAMHYLPDNPTDATRLEPSQIQVGNTESGRPYLTGNLPRELQAADLSLSHGAGYATAIVSQSYCGHRYSGKQGRPAKGKRQVLHPGGGAEP